MMRDIFARAIKTFFQAAAGELIYAVNTGIDITDESAVTGVVIAVVSAGVSALWNLGLNYARSRSSRFPDNEIEEDDE